MSPEEFNTKRQVIEAKYYLLNSIDTCAYHEEMDKLMIEALKSKGFDIGKFNMDEVWYERMKL
jgi:hypothetical protein